MPLGCPMNIWDNATLDISISPPLLSSSERPSHCLWGRKDLARLVEVTIHASVSSCGCIHLLLKHSCFRIRRIAVLAESDIVEVNEVPKVTILSGEEVDGFLAELEAKHDHCPAELPCGHVTPVAVIHSLEGWLHQHSSRQDPSADQVFHNVKLRSTLKRHRHLVAPCWHCGCHIRHGGDRKGMLLESSCTEGSINVGTKVFVVEHAVCAGVCHHKIVQIFFGKLLGETQDGQHSLHLSASAV
mmetsp:Transcript_16440/g.37908  ORF Transcript_16440/g.37908 Transcript_16440/m.37908 type:complete len:243 (+) Transcript_16440:86-814(+)